MTPPNTSPRLDRRSLVRAGLAAVAVGAACRGARAQSSTGAPAIHTGQTPFSEADLLRALVERVTWGWTPEEQALAESLGPEAYVDYHLNWEGIDDSETEAALHGFPSLSMTSNEIYEAYFPFGGTSYYELKSAHIFRAVNSKRQLLERLVGYWHEHFSIYHANGVLQWLLTDFDRQLRDSVGATFHDLLGASMHSAAMLHSLDNDTNLAGSPQENYARELMELHTIGTEGTFTESDVVELAKVLSGHGWLNYKPNYGQYQFTAAHHESGVKRVLGLDIDEGPDGAAAVAKHLCSLPANAEFVSRRLCRHFLHADVSAEAVRDVTQAYHSSGGDLRQTLRVMLSPEVLIKAGIPQRKAFLRPLRFAIGQLRRLPIQLPKVTDLNADPATRQQWGKAIVTFQELGQAPFDWPTPDGFPVDESAWNTNLLPRWQFVGRLWSDSFFNGFAYDLDALKAALGHPTASSLALAACELVGGQSHAPHEIDRIHRYVQIQGFSNRTLREAVELAASAPSQQFI
jgi:hypothetical protein